MVAAILTTLPVVAGSTASAAVNNDTLSSKIAPASDVTTTGWTKGGTCVSGFYQCVSDDPDSPDDTNYDLGPKATNTNNTITLGLGSMPADFLAAQSVEVRARFDEIGGVDDTETVNYQVLDSGSNPLTAASNGVVATSTLATYGSTLAIAAPQNNNATTWNSAHLVVKSVWAATGGTDVNIQAKLTAVEVKINYVTTNFSKLTQDGYIFENDDGANVNSNTVQAAGNTAITNVTKGERLTVRVQLKNTGAALDPSRQLGLFYDDNNGYFTKVKGAASPVSGTGTCTGDTAWNCTTIDSGTGIGKYTSVAIAPDGRPWISYDNNSGTQTLHVAQFVGSGGTGCANSAAWTCSQITSGTGVSFGQYTSIAFDANGVPWIAYYSVANTDLYIAKYTPGAGSGCGTGGSADWTCSNVEVDGATTDRGQYASLAFDSSGNPWIAYYDATNTKLRYARYVVSGGSGCAGGTTAWTCADVDAPSSTDVGQFSSLRFDPSGAAWISFFDNTNGHLWVAKYVATGGSGCSTGITAWTCSEVDGSTGTGRQSVIAFAPDGNAWIAYRDTAASKALRVANFVGSGGNCTGNAAWNCTDIDVASTSVGLYPSIGFAPDGTPWVSTGSTTASDTSMRLARYVGGSSGTGCGAGASTAWTCEDIDGTSNAAQYTSLAFDQSGTPWVAYFDSTNSDLRIATLNRGGELTVAPSLAGTNGASITSSHADMTSASDSTNKADADCLTATTWNNGLSFDAENGTGLSIPAGSSTSQCTEVAFTIDTSQATVGQTYRLVVASNDGWRNDKAMWRGPISVAAYATFTVQSPMLVRDSKDDQADFANCSNTSWGCSTVDTGDSTVGNDTSTAFDNQGTPWISSIDQSAGTIQVEHYVNSGGSCSNTAWACTVVDTVSATKNTQTSIGIDSTGAPWVSYYDAGAKALKVAHYVGSGGTGCTSSAWTCVTVDATDQNGEGSSLGVDRNGSIWVAYSDETAGTIRIAHNVVGGGSGCTSTAWSCTTIDGGTGLSFAATDNSLAFDQYNNPYIATKELTSNSLRLDHYVGTGGSGCGSLGSTAWTCTEIDNSGNDGAYASLAIDASGNMWIGEWDSTSNYLRVAQYVVSGGTGCGAGGSSAWKCVTVDSSGSPRYASLALDAAGTPWLAYEDTSTGKLRYAEYVGSSGSCTSTAWNCSTVDSSVSTGGYPSLAFDRSDTPWITMQDVSPNYLRISKLHTPPNPMSYAPKTNIAGGRNAIVADGRYHLDSGKSPRTQTGACSATSNQQGYCGITTSGDGYSDTDNAAANEEPIYEASMYETSNAVSPTVSWIGQSSVAPSSNGITVQFYRYGTTNAWENIVATTNTCTSAGANSACTIQATALGTAGEYYKADGSGYWVNARIIQPSSASATSLRTDAMIIDQAPNGLSLESQANTAGNTTIPTGTWWNQTTLTFSAFGSDVDTTDSLSLCVEVKAINVAFTNANDVCGTPVASTSGNAVALSVQKSGLSSGTQYHWQARVEDAAGFYTSWVSYGGNSDGSPPGTPAAMDVGIDTVAPTTGTVYDGSSAGVESHYNSGSLSSLSGNWSGFSDALSSIASYDYSLGTSPGDTSVVGWTNTASTSFTATGLTLQTSQMYYVNVRAYDGAGNLSSVVSSAGQLVAPTLTFSVSSSSVHFAALNASDSYTDSQTFNLTTSTDAYNGYSIAAYEGGPMTSAGAQTVANYASPISTPTVWSGSGFGYNVSGGAAIGAFSGSKYAHFGTSASPDIPVAHITTVSGTPISNEAEAVTVKIAAPATQAAGSYSTTLVWSCTAVF